MPNSMIRCQLYEPVNCPKAVLVGDVLGGMNCGWFSALMNCGGELELQAFLDPGVLDRGHVPVVHAGARTPLNAEDRRRMLDASCWLELRLKALS